MTDLHRALVISVGKNAAWVAIDGEHGIRLAGLRRMAGKRSMPVPGDIAQVRMRGDDSTVIDALEPRRFVLERRTAGGRTKTIAANVDAMVTVTALADPAPRLGILDQLLAFSELESIEAVVVFTKPDLGDAAERSRLESLYAGLGYRVVTVNPKRGENLDDLRGAIAGKRALLSGNSGVGKSSIFRALGGETTVGETSRHGLGKQTTTTARLYRMGDGFLIDSPGINEFGLGAIGARELAPAFIEMRAPAERCRFGDCTHQHEPDCGVRDALEAGAVAPSRYSSYLRILTEGA